jgi:hypothetical protein
MSGLSQERLAAEATAAGKIPHDALTASLMEINGSD